jgi:uncharacterized protein YyaL (SSP411 family)
MTLQTAIQAMAVRRGDDYRPRTRHLDERGRAVYTNRLFLETSPYLLQHAHNPVDWHPWGDAAFDSARRRDCPVLLSVGYATCHWCHVMEAESFEDEEIAAFLNAHYIAVKVDREERPDVDAVYMSAVQIVAGRGGWPMTVWLTPDRKPFYAGTYFPARDGDRGAAVGFLSLLKTIRRSYDQRRDSVARCADELSRQIRRVLAPASGNRLPAADVTVRAVAAVKTRFDARHGGVAGATKFPSSLPIRLLLRYHRHTGDAQSLDMVTLTLDRMAAGGIHDQVGGGFHRYATDATWRVPHFEKMLYDNALLVQAYIDGWQATGNAHYKRVAVRTLEYVVREMTAPEGGFYAATDADSLTPGGRRQEGWFFTWTLDELKQILGADDARVAIAAYAVTPGGNFEGRSVLHRPGPDESVAARLGLSRAQLAEEMTRIDAVLYGHRRQRPAPLRDDKILAAWNGLMISAFARAGSAFDDAGYLAVANRAADFVRDRMIIGGRLQRSFANGVARIDAFLEDYAFYIAALLDLFAATAQSYRVAQATALAQVLAERYADDDNGGFFMTADDHAMRIAREKPVRDGALPSGNAVALMNLVRLHKITGNTSYRRRAEMGFSAFSAVIEANPSACGEMLLAWDQFLGAKDG